MLHYFSHKPVVYLSWVSMSPVFWLSHSWRVYFFPSQIYVWLWVCCFSIVVGFLFAYFFHFFPESTLCMILKVWKEKEQWDRKKKKKKRVLIGTVVPYSSTISKHLCIVFEFLSYLTKNCFVLCVCKQTLPEVLTNPILKFSRSSEISVLSKNIFIHQT